VGVFFWLHIPLQSPAMGQSSTQLTGAPADRSTQPFDLESLIPGDWLSISSLEDVVEIVVTPSGITWVATSGGVYGVDPTSQQVVDVFTTNDGLHAPNPTSMAVTPNGDLLILGYSDGALNTIDLTNRQVRLLNDIVRSTRFPDKSIRSIVTQGEQAYIATGFGIVVYDATSWLVRESTLQFDSWPVGVGVISMDLDPNGSLWVSTPQGVATISLTETLSFPSNWGTWSVDEVSSSTPFAWIRAFSDEVVAATDRAVYHYDNVLGWRQWEQAGSMETFDAIDIPGTEQKVLLQRIRLLVLQVMISLRIFHLKIVLQPSNYSPLQMMVQHY